MKLGKTYKQAVEDITGEGYAVYSIHPDIDHGHEGHFNGQRDADGKYRVDGRLDGVRVHIEGTEEGIDALLEEMTINPNDRWSTLSY